LEDFAKEFDLSHVVRFGTFVERVELVTMDSIGDENQWKVITTKRINGVVDERKDGVVDERKEEVFDAVVVCSGHYFEPKIANIPGIFSLSPSCFFKLKIICKKFVASNQMKS
jgi:cation diffusion facilitator CzcD-associated flavoprotein CzcO